MQDKPIKYIRVTFSQGSIYDIPLAVIIKYYAKNVVMQSTDYPTPLAMTYTDHYFNNNPEALMEFINNGMAWNDILLHSDIVKRMPGENKSAEWKEAQKQLIEI